MEKKMDNKNNNKNRNSEKGNVLFLILIAVALFAALSYAVTQSTRSGGGSTAREKSILSSASMTQGPTAMRTALIRMVLSGTDVSNLYFNSPASDFGGVSDTGTLVFHPEGGGAVFQQAPADFMTGSAQGTWFYNGHFEVPDIGTAGSGGNEIIAFLPGVSLGVCQQINEEFAISTTGCDDADTNGVPDLAAAATEGNIRDNFEDGDTFPTGDQDDLQGDNCTAFSGQPSGCFYDEDTEEAVFYSVLLER